MMKFIELFVMITLLALIISCQSTGQKIADNETIIPYQHNEKYLIAVIPFNNKSNNREVDNYSGSLDGLLISKLSELGRYRVIERERLDGILKEAKLSLAGLTDSTSAKQLGRLLGADALCFVNIVSVNIEEKLNTVVLASIREQLVEVVMDARIVDVEKGEILASTDCIVKMKKDMKTALGVMKTGELKDKEALISEALNEGTRILARKLSKQAPKK